MFSFQELTQSLILDVRKLITKVIAWPDSRQLLDTTAETPHGSILFHLTGSFLSKRPIAVIKFILLCSISRSKRSSVYFTKMRTNSQVFKFGIPLIVVSVLVGVAMILAITLSGKPRTKGELRKCTSRWCQVFTYAAYGSTFNEALPLPGEIAH